VRVILTVTDCVDDDGGEDASRDEEECSSEGVKS
jgi:hypothetical protein